MRYILVLLLLSTSLNAADSKYVESKYFKEVKACDRAVRKIIKELKLSKIEKEVMDHFLLLGCLHDVAERNR